VATWQSAEGRRVGEEVTELIKSWKVCFVTNRILLAIYFPACGRVWGYVLVLVETK